MIRRWTLPNPEVYKVLTDVFTEVAALFPDEYIHIGGDENAGNHWDQNEDIQEFMKKNNFASNHELQVHFTLQLQKAINGMGKKNYWLGRSYGS